jgi:hypothetical protein
VGSAHSLVLRGFPATRAALRCRRLIATALVTLWAAGSAAQTVPPADPASPDGLSVRANSGGVVTFAWSPPAIGPAESYVIDGGLVPGQTLVSLPTGTDAPAFTLQVRPGVYYARVRASVGGTLSGPSNEVRLVVGASEPPSAPAHLLGLVNGTALALSWTPTFSGGEPALVGLVVQGPVSGVVPLGLAETFDVANVPAGTYTIQALAANAAGLSAPSNVVTLSVPAPCTGVPGPPVGLVAERWDRIASVSWLPPDTGAAVTQYRLFVYAPGDETPSVVTVPGGRPVSPTYGFSVPLRTRQVAGALSPSWYTFTVAAENACGAGALSAPVTLIIP